MPTTDDLAALARSSPWRWSTLRFTVRRHRDGRWAEPVRAWLRRPDVLRVETVAGELLQVVREPRQQVAVLSSDGRGGTVTLPWAVDRDAPRAVLRPDGLVAERPSRWEVGLDVPMYQDYFWVAVLDPAEFADGEDPDTGECGAPLEVDAVTEVDHAGRPAWEAVVRTTPFYDPRCGCCPLLDSLGNARREYAANGWALPRDPDAYPDAWRVRLDVGTGVCVLTEELTGAPRGDGHELRIEAVDEPMDDALFR